MFVRKKKNLTAVKNKNQLNSQNGRFKNKTLLRARSKFSNIDYQLFVKIIIQPKIIFRKPLIV